MNALELLRQELDAECIPTGSQQLDLALCNGFRAGTISEITGKSGAGKTQICLQLTVNTIIPRPLGLVSGEVVFISTKRNFCPQRLNQMIKRFGLIWDCTAVKNGNKFQKFSVESALKKIHHKLVLSTCELVETVYQLKEFISLNPNVRLVVIDSFSTHLRGLTALEKVRVVHELLHILTEIANVDANHKCAVLLTNDLTTQIIGPDDSILRPELGDLFHQRVQQRILLVKDDNQQTIAQVQKNLVNGPALVKLRITANGVEGD